MQLAQVWLVIIYAAIIVVQLNLVYTMLLVPQEDGVGVAVLIQDH